MLKWMRHCRACGLAVHEQTRNRVELIAEVEADRPDRRLVAQARPDGVAQVVQIESQRSAHTLPPSRNSTPPRLPCSDSAQLLRLNASMLLPPIGDPVPPSGLTS